MDATHGTCLDSVSGDPGHWHGDAGGGAVIHSTYACDKPGCSLTRGSANHWAIVRIMDNHLEFWRWDRAADAGLLDDSASRHFCGPAHALSFVSTALGQKEEV